MGRRKLISDEKLGEALKKTLGLQSHAASLIEKTYGIKITPQAIGQRIANSEYLKKCLEEITAKSLDLAEGKLLKAINDDNLSAIIFYLKTKGRDRGYCERSEITGGNGEPLQTGEIKIYIPDNGRDKEQ